MKKAGFKKKHLKKKETALAIYEVLLRGIEFDTIKTQIKGGQGHGRTSSGLTNDFNRLSNDDTRALAGGHERTNSQFGMNLTTQNNLLGANLMSQNYMDPR